MENIGSGGGIIELQEFGIKLNVPPNAVSTMHSSPIKLSVITDVSRYVQIQDDEIAATFGFQCLPEGLQLDKPVSVTIPHCAVVRNSESLTPVIYSGRGEIGKFFLAIISL